MKVFKYKYLLLILIPLILLVSCSANKNNITFMDKTFSYDGSAKSIYISGNLPKDVTVEYEGNDKVDIGVYVVKATFTSSNGSKYMDDLFAKMTIVEELGKIKSITYFNEEGKDITNLFDQIYCFYRVGTVQDFPIAYRNEEGQKPEFYSDEEMLFIKDHVTETDVTDLIIFVKFVDVT
ncbi:MAG: hypothetical protein ACRC5M_02940 [Anaeroplasmataceae bacterium]